MERHLRGRHARRRLSAGALLAACLAAACVPLAPFERPDPAEVEEQAPAPPPEGAAAAEAPDLPEPGDDVAQPSAPGPAEAAPEEPVEETGQAEASRAAEPAPAAAPAGDPVQAEVRGVLASFYAAYNAREWQQARAHFWDGATITDVRILPEQPAPAVQVATVAEFFKELALAREAGPDGFEGRLEGAPEVRTASNVAQAWCHFRASFGGPQESMSWRRVDAFTFVLHEGTWKIASLAQSSSFDVPDSR